MTQLGRKLVEIYTDGACRGNPGPGGWGVLLRYDHTEKTLYGGEWDTTNNRMELRAAIEGLNALKRSCHVILVTDSEYVKKGITQWIKNWRLKNWKNTKGHPIKNQDLWQALEAAIARHEVEWRWVKGHSNHAENDYADKLANKGIDSLYES